MLVTPEEPGAAAAWDSGQVESALTADIAYGGEASGGHGGVAPPGGSRAAPLTAGGRYRWKVRVWDEAGSASGWSDPARFEIELDRTSGWHASWIGPSRVRERGSQANRSRPPVRRSHARPRAGAG